MADQNKISYIIVTVSSNEKSEEKFTGYFLAVKPIETRMASKNPDKYVWLSSKGQIFILHPDFYSIKLIEIARHTAIKKTSTTTYSSGDNLHAINKLEELYEELKKADAVDKDGLIDMSKFDSADTKISNGFQTDKKASTTQKSNTQLSTLYNNKTGTKKDQDTVSTSIIKRTTRYNAAEAIEKMAEKIKKLQEGEYENDFLNKQLKKLSAKVEADESNTSKADKGSEDDDLDDDVWNHYMHNNPAFMM